MRRRSVRLILLLASAGVGSPRYLRWLFRCVPHSAYCEPAENLRLPAPRLSATVGPLSVMLLLASSMIADRVLSLGIDLVRGLGRVFTRRLG